MSVAGFDQQDPYSAVANRLVALLGDIGPTIVACSGGVDSLLLATLCHRSSMQKDIIVAHALSPAVPAAATERVTRLARAEGWRLELIDSGEFSDPVYRANPVNRCYYCKTHLYTALSMITEVKVSTGAKRHTIVSGANLDDLGEYRPGLEAAREFDVRHPFVEAGMAKRHIREMARRLGLSFADLPASPCLASRLYTGTTVTASRLSAVEHGEEFLKEHAGVEVVRCRVKGDQMRIEVADEDRRKLTSGIVAKLRKALQAVNPAIRDIQVDPLPYSPGRAFVQSS